MHKAFYVLIACVYLPFIDFMILWLRGESGAGPAQFNIPHSVTLDAVGRVKPPCVWNSMCVGGWAYLDVCVWVGDLSIRRCFYFISIAVINKQT